MVSLVKEIIMISAVAILAQSSQAQGLAELYRQARINDPKYAAAEAQREAVEALLPQARGQLLPNISFNLTRTLNNTTNRVAASAGDLQKTYDFVQNNGSLNLSQAVFRPQIWIAYAQTQVQVLQAEAVLRQAEQDLVLRLSQSYFDVLLAEDNVALAQEQKAAIAEQLKQAKRYFEAGVGTITDINEAQARYDTIQAQELAAQNTLEVKVRALEQIVGTTHRVLDRLGGRLRLESPEPAKVDEWIDFSLANNPDLKASEAAFEIAEKEVYKNRAAHLPTVDIIASRSNLQNPSYSLIDNYQWVSSLGVQVAFPLFTGGATQGRVVQAGALKEKARHDLEFAKRTTILLTRQEFLNVHNGVAQVKALEQAVKSNEVALYSARRGQEAGMRTSFDVLNAQQLLFAAKRDLAQARYAYVLSRLKLRSAAGLLAEDDVQLVQSWLEK